MATVGVRRLALPAKRITNFASRFNQLDGLLERKYSSYLRFPNSKQATQMFSTNVYQRQQTESRPFQASAQLKEISIDHFGREGNTSGDEEYRMPHPVWSEEDVYSVEISHEAPEKFVDKLAYWSVQALRTTFDVATLYHVKELDENRWLNRIIMLETIAGVPGMIGAMTRHFHALRKLTRDNGWIHTLLEEAENERMHLMTALEMKQPGIVFRGLILLAQGTFVNLFFLAYLLSPRFCHRFVGYLEEEAVKTYTHCLKTLDSGQLPLWQNQLAPKIAVNYWKLPEGSTMRDVILVIRADEAHHRVVNHTLSSMPLDAPNPFLPGKKKL